MGYYNDNDEFCMHSDLYILVLVFFLKMDGGIFILEQAYTWLSRCVVKMKWYNFFPT